MYTLPRALEVNVRAPSRPCADSFLRELVCYNPYSFGFFLMSLETTHELDLLFYPRNIKIT
jgi:hypothetical protein